MTIFVISLILLL